MEEIKYQDSDPYKNDVMRREDEIKECLGLPQDIWHSLTTVITVGLPPEDIQPDFNYNGVAELIRDYLVNAILVVENFPRCALSSVSWKNFITDIKINQQPEGTKIDTSDYILQKTLYPFVEIHIRDNLPGTLACETAHIDISDTAWKIGSCISKALQVLLDTLPLKDIMEVYRHIRTNVGNETEISNPIFKNFYADEVLHRYGVKTPKYVVEPFIIDPTCKDFELAEFMLGFFKDYAVPMLAVPASNPYADVKVVTYYLGRFYMGDQTYNNWNTFRVKFIPVRIVNPIEFMSLRTSELKNLIS